MGESARHAACGHVAVNDVANPPKSPSRLARFIRTPTVSPGGPYREILPAGDLGPIRGFLRWWEGVHAAVDQDIRCFRKQLRRCRRRRSMESVHELRVATRRLLVWSDWLNAMDQGKPPPKARKRLRALFRGLSRMRDCQVHQTLLERVPERFRPVVREVQQRLRAEESDLSQRVRRRCRFQHGWFYKGIPRRVKLLAPFAAGIRSLSPSRRWIGSLSGIALDRAPRPGSKRPDSWHRWRVALKRLRFAVESVGLSPGDPWTPRRLQRVLKPLGVVQDLDSLAGFLQEAVISGRLDHPDVEQLLRWVEGRRDQGIRRLAPYAAYWRCALASKKPVSSGRGAP